MAAKMSQLDKSVKSVAKIIQGQVMDQMPEVFQAEMLPKLVKDEEYELNPEEAAAAEKATVLLAYSFSKDLNDELRKGRPASSINQKLLDEAFPELFPKPNPEEKASEVAATNAAMMKLRAI